MEPITPTPQKPEEVNQTPAVPAPQKEVPKPEVKDNHWMTILAMAIFVILSLSAVVFLYYQNQQLKGMLSSYESMPSPTALPTVSATPTIEPTTSASPTATPTASGTASPTGSPTPTP